MLLPSYSGYSSVSGPVILTKPAERIEQSTLASTRPALRSIDRPRLAPSAQRFPPIEKQKVIEKMSTGRISHYDEGRGFGFIIPDDGGADVFVHANYLVNADALKKDQRVSFEVVNDDRRGKPRADKVRVL
jgi:cold shock protein